MANAREDVIHAAMWVPPRCKQAKNLARRFEKHGDAYFKFITTPGVQPTNNLAEQAIRFCVIDRKITQGTRGEPGRRWCEPIWTVIATCTQQDDQYSITCAMPSAPSSMVNPSPPTTPPGLERLPDS